MNPSPNIAISMGDHIRPQTFTKKIADPEVYLY